MDKHYKPHFTELVASGMRMHLPAFDCFKLPRTIQLREIFTGMALYQRELASGKVAWVCWEPGGGVERTFNVYLGWSSAVNHLPHSGGHHTEFLELTGPSGKFAAGLLNLEQIEGKFAIGGIRIPTPWDELLQVPVMAPKRTHDAVVQKAFMEAEALSAEQRRHAVQTTLEGVFGRLLSASCLISRRSWESVNVRSNRSFDADAQQRSFASLRSSPPAAGQLRR
ncbi:MAG TPA: hypothetical protein VIL30_07765 [Ramlibacter sp.]